MSTLTYIEKGMFLKLFIREGYVLNFTTNDFDIFTMESVGVALCQKYNMSKGKSLSAFVTSATDTDCNKLLLDLFRYYEVHYEEEYNPFTEGYGYRKFNSECERLYKKCKECVSKITDEITPFIQTANELKFRFSSEYLSQQINAMMKLQLENPTDAIGKAKELIESCCKTILDEEGIQYENNWEMSKLTGETLKLLKLTPDCIPETEPISESIKAILGNLRGITSKLAEIRNPYGSGHGKSANYNGLEIRHAKLAVNCSITFVTFLWDTYEGRSE